ncbi:putative Eukaryotic translation initiation factor 3 subunit A [Blattamonas nauphoetae]|uniref:Eukaryotic translation initiation factor 3 subunit A n=1 Tax=Blattamonas nauphoetae TaxID=2049346 RepID=A0ABQ9YM58_9EUKA|nr:putative Eukaryotic translation initiation factor 3 subunit A [Blattamonas nauphoetae]
MTYRDHYDSVHIQAKNMIQIGAVETALDVLQASLLRKRDYNRDYEEATKLFVQLAVKQKKDLSVIKEVLTQYRFNSQNVAIQSFGIVLTTFLDSVQEQVEAAEKTKQDLAAPTDDPNKDATTALRQSNHDVDVIAPLHQFLFASYRMCLDLIRAHLKLDTLYEKIVKLAFDFCVTNQRKKDFSYLCDQLRNHLEKLISGESFTQGRSAIISTSEGIHRQLQIRLDQMDTAVKLGSYKEAFKTVEDIQRLLQTSTLPIRASFLRVYYAKLVDLFWICNHFFLHSQVEFELFLLRLISYQHRREGQTTKRDQEALEEIQTTATLALLSALCIPQMEPEKNSNDLVLRNQAERDRMADFATTLGFNKRTDRKTYIEELLEKDILNIVPQPIAELFKVAETECQPKILSRESQRLLEAVKEMPIAAPYYQAIKHVLIVKIVKQCSLVYSSLSLTTLGQLCFDLSPVTLQLSLFSIFKQTGITARINQRTNSIVFLSSLEDTGSFLTNNSKSNLLPRFACEVHRSVCVLAETLEPHNKSRASSINEPPSLKCILDSAIAGSSDRMDTHTVRTYFLKVMSALPQTRNDILKRSLIIEERKEYREIQNRQISEKDLRIRQLEHEEKEREERERRMKEQKKRDDEEKRYKEQQRRIGIAKQFASVLKVTIDPDVLAKGDADSIEQYVKTKEEELNRLQIGTTRVVKQAIQQRDFFIRAAREREIPLRREFQKKAEEKAYQNYLDVKEERAHKDREEWERLIKLRESIHPMEHDARIFMEAIDAKRQNVHRIRNALAEMLQNQRQMMREEDERMTALIEWEIEEERRAEEEEYIRLEREEQERLAKEKLERDRLQMEKARAASAWKQKAQNPEAATTKPAAVNDPFKRRDDDSPVPSNDSTPVPSEEPKSRPTPAWKQKAQTSETTRKPAADNDPWKRRDDESPAPSKDTTPVPSDEQKPRATPAWKNKALTQTESKPAVVNDPWKRRGDDSPVPSNDSTPVPSEEQKPRATPAWKQKAQNTETTRKPAADNDPWKRRGDDSPAPSKSPTQTTAEKPKAGSWKDKLQKTVEQPSETRDKGDEGWETTTKKKSRRKADEEDDGWSSVPSKSKQ